jgi:beta-alanine degradation protein BauB
MVPVSTNVGTELLFENDRVRVWQMLLAPGESSEMHRHEHDYLFVHLTRTKLESRAPDSDEVRMFDCEDGFVSFSVVGADGRPPHQVRNVADELHRQIVVELLGPSEASEEQPAQTNGRKAGESDGER